ncbi:hypothetical protein ABPG74_006247 [Tetrahymena malaccensis]
MKQNSQAQLNIISSKGQNIFLTNYLIGAYQGTIKFLEKDHSYASKLFYIVNDQSNLFYDSKILKESSKKREFSKFEWLILSSQRVLSKMCFIQQNFIQRQILFSQSM